MVHALASDAITSAITVVEILGHHSTGTPATGFGSGFQFQLDSSTTANRVVAEIDALWATATDATRKARVVHYVYDTVAREAFREEADGAQALLGFLGAAAVAQQSIGAAATDAASTQTLANNIRTALINLGLCKT
jgi:hypothetical protein